MGKTILIINEDIMTKYNGWTNWETWNVYNNFEFETKQDLENIRYSITERYENIKDDFMKSFIDINIINWKELLSKCEA